MAQHMKKHLGRAWQIFTRAALRLGKPVFMRAFSPGNVWCRGPLNPIGVFCSDCLHGRGQWSYPPTDKIHGDHTIDLNNICTSWLKAQTPQPKSWGDDIDVSKIINVLFKFAPEHLVFRCEDCHSSKPHYDRAITPADLAKSGTCLNPIVLH